jgi:hypothetical protein
MMIKSEDEKKENLGLYLNKVKNDKWYHYY